MSRFSAFVIRVLRGHLGHVLLAVSWSFILFVLVRRTVSQPLFVACTPVGDEIYTITESLRLYPIWTAAVGMAHFPAMLVTMALTRLFQAVFSLSCAPTAKVELPLFFAFSAIQWLLVGYMIESLVQWARSRL